MLNLVHHADDSLPNDEELAPLDEIEQVKGEIDQGPFHTEFQIAQSREEDMLPPSGAPFNPECNNFIFTIISINLMHTAHIHCYLLTFDCRGSFVEANSAAGCCNLWPGKSFERYGSHICSRCPVADQ